MNCNPIVKNKTISSSTCYTPDIILRIRDEYNKNHSVKEAIQTNVPNQIWKILKKRLHTCKKEDCWLKEIKDENLRKHIDEYIFAPDSPPEWNKDPNEWLTDVDIKRVMKQYEKIYSDFRFIGPAPIDFDFVLDTSKKNCVTQELCTFSVKEQLAKNIRKIGIVFNTDEHYKGGSHWISLFIDLDDQFIYYFDSVGNDTPGEIKILKNRIIEEAKTLNPPLSLEYYSNHPTSHQQSNTECGMYSLFFIITMLTGDTDFIKNLSKTEKIDLFSKEKIPDEYIEKFRKIYFNN
jgi:hypothetical protein